MSTHSYELEQAWAEAPDPETQRPHTVDTPAEEDDDLMYDLIGAAVRGFHTPYHPL